MVNLRSIEIAKGFSILIILFSNTIYYWLYFGDELKYIYGFILTVLDVIGPSLYIFLASFSVSFTLKKKMGHIPEKSNRNKILKQGSYLILLGSFYNLLLNATCGFPQNIWGWNILFFLGFSQIICYYSYKMVRWARLVIGITILFLTLGIREALYFGKDTNPVIEIIYFFVVSPFPIYSLLPFAAISFFSTVFGELIYESIMLDSDVANIRSTRSVIKYGWVLLTIALLVPFIDIGFIITVDNFNPTKYPFIDGISILITHFVQFIPGSPLFLLKGTPSNLFFIMGLSLFIIGVTYYLFDVLHINNKIAKILSIYGKYSLTLLLIQFLFLPIFYQKLTILLFFQFSISYIILLGFLIYFWEKFGKSILSLDWMFKKVGGNIKD